MSFFDKLKKGMGVEGPIKENFTEEPAELIKPKKRSPRRKKEAVLKAEEIKNEAAPEIPEEKPEEIKKIEIDHIEEPLPKPQLPSEKAPEEPSEPVTEDKKWFEPEGQLAVDIYQTEADLVIQSAVAGVRIENLDISLERDIMIIRGKRENPYKETGDYFSQECYWGTFSREIILPAEIDPDKVKAKMQDGVLTIRLPKILREKKRKITILS